MEHYISKQKLLKYKAKLVEERARLLSMIQEKSEQVQEKMEGTGDVIDIAAEHEKYLSIKREIQRFRVSIQRIDNSLRDFDDFGYCLDCGIEIGEDRMDIDPSYKLCVSCAEINEKKERLNINKRVL